MQGRHVVVGTHRYDECPSPSGSPSGSTQTMRSGQQMRGRWFPVSMMLVRGPSRVCDHCCLGLTQRVRSDRVAFVAGGRETMPKRAWNPKRERQYDHIKAGLLERGDPEALAEEVAARTVNKERARAGESEQSSRTSTDDISSGRRGGLRSHRGPGGRTRDQLYEEARRRGVKGRSTMSKSELEKAVDR